MRREARYRRADGYAEEKNRAAEEAGEEERRQRENPGRLGGEGRGRVGRPADAPLEESACGFRRGMPHLETDEGYAGAQEGEQETPLAAPCAGSNGRLQDGLLLLRDPLSRAGQRKYRVRRRSTSVSSPHPCIFTSALLQ